jgi:hypothetical protein
LRKEEWTVDRIPGWLKALVLVVVIIGTGWVVYNRIWWYTKGQQQARMRVKEQWESGQAFGNTGPLREKGSQAFGEYEVTARHVRDNDFADVTIRKKDGERVTEEIAAGTMTVELASEGACRVRLSGLTITEYDEEAGPSTKTMETAVMFLTNSGRGPTGIIGADWIERQPR